MQLYREDEDPKEDEPYENISDVIEPKVQQEMDVHVEFLLSEPTLPTMNGPCKAKIVARRGIKMEI
jgi:hypothetical protein